MDRSVLHADFAGKLIGLALFTFCFVFFPWYTRKRIAEGKISPDKERNIRIMKVCFGLAIAYYVIDIVLTWMHVW